MIILLDCFIKGARWDINTGVIVESKLKELHPTMPIIYIKAVSQEINVKYLLRNFRKYISDFFQDKQELKTLYECPIYKTRQRCEIIEISFFINKYSTSGPTYIWTFNLKTKAKPSKWVLAGVALLLQI